MDTLLQLLIVMPFVMLFAIVVVALMRQQNEHFHDLEAAYQRRHAVHRTAVRSPVRSVRIQQPAEEPVEPHDVVRPVRHAA